MYQRALGILAAAIIGCGGTSTPDGNTDPGGTDQKPDPFASCNPPGDGCKITWSGAVTGTLDCEVTTASSGSYFNLKVAPPSSGSVSYPNALITLLFASKPAPGTYRASEMTGGNFSVVTEKETSWTASQGMSNPKGDFTVKLSEASSVYHGLAIGTLVSDSSSASGTLTFCARF